MLRRLNLQRQHRAPWVAAAEALKQHGVRVAVDALVFRHSPEDCQRELGKRAAGGGRGAEAHLRQRLLECAPYNPITLYPPQRPLECAPYNPIPYTLHLRQRPLECAPACRRVSPRIGNLDRSVLLPTLVTLEYAHNCHSIRASCGRLQSQEPEV